MIAATKAIQVGWERITTDLKYLNEAAKGDKIPDVEFDKVFIQQSIEGWNQFGVYGIQFRFYYLLLITNSILVDSFRKSAYLFEPEAMTIDKWAEKIGQ